MIDREEIKKHKSTAFSTHHDEYTLPDKETMQKYNPKNYKKNNFISVPIDKDSIECVQIKLKNYEAKDAVLVVDDHLIFGYGEHKSYVSDQIQKANDKLLKYLHKKEMAVFAEKIAKFAHLAGDGKDKYIKALEIGFNDIDVMVYEERCDGSKKFTDDEFKQLLDDCHVKY